jgi:hypothetical protein
MSPSDLPVVARPLWRKPGFWIALVLLAGVGYPLQYLVRYTAFHNFAPEVVASSKASGELIIEALRQHRVREGQFPASIAAILATLAPEHRAPAAGERRWKYVRRSDGTCQLSFKVQGPNYFKWYAESASDFQWLLDH